jgi:hypothetical protein
LSFLSGAGGVADYGNEACREILQSRFAASSRISQVLDF